MFFCTWPVPNFKSKAKQIKAKQLSILRMSFTVGVCSELPEPYQTYQFDRPFRNMTSQLASLKRSSHFFNYFRSFIFAILEIIYDNLKVIKELLRDIVEAILCKFANVIEMI